MSRRGFDLELVEPGKKKNASSLFSVFTHKCTNTLTRTRHFQHLPLGERNFKFEENYYKTAQKGAAFVGGLVHVHKRGAVSFKISPHRGKKITINSHSFWTWAGVLQIVKHSQRVFRGFWERRDVLGLGWNIWKLCFYCLLPVVSPPCTAASQAIMLALSQPPHISS